MQTLKFEGIIIGYENWGDVDRLISFYTPLQGKIEAVAKGVRHEKSKLKGHLEILTHGEFMIAKNRGHGVLTDAISQETFCKVRTDPVLAYVGAAIAEMYDAYLFPHAADEELWRVLRETLGELSAFSSMDSPQANSKAIYLIAHDFAQNFLRHLGYLDKAVLSSERANGILQNLPGGSVVRDADLAYHGVRAYDALLAHTDIAGPTFSGIQRGLQQLGCW